MLPFSLALDLPWPLRPDTEGELGGEAVSLA